MNYWTRQSVNFANQHNYLDELFKVYPISPNLRRSIPNTIENSIIDAFNSQDNERLIKELLKLELFPIKDSYVAYLRNDASAISRNPQTINRLAGTLYSMGLTEIFNKCTEAKETNRQMGPLFKRWLDGGFLGVPVYKSSEEFLSNNENAVLNVSDNEMQLFASEYLGYNHDKGLDFIARFNGKYVIGEAKFLTDFGGHQNAQFADAVSTITSNFNNNILGAEVIPIAILDGVLYIEGNNKMYKYINNNEQQIILSSLVLREFLYSL